MDAAPDPETTHDAWNWERLACAVSALVHTWETGPAEPPTLTAFVPDGPAAFRRVVLIELVKADLACRARAGLTLRRIEDYLQDFPELADGGPPSELLGEEFGRGRLPGASPTAGEHPTRLPTRPVDEARRTGDGLPTRSNPATEAGLTPLDALDSVPSLDEFDLLLPLGRGGFARVFLARQRSMQRLVALKVSADRGAEPQTLARLDHPHIVRVHDQRLLPDRGLRLLYMQYLPGGTLSGVVPRVLTAPPAARTGRLLLDAVDECLSARGETPTDSPQRRWVAGLSWPQAVCWLGARVADALHYAHGRGVLHRDVKPANVLLAADGTPLLADFNVSGNAVLEDVGPRAIFGGSLAYMAPEHLEAYDPAHDRRADTLDGRCDVYSLAITLWELLAGRRPFRDELAPGGRDTVLRELVRRRQEGPADHLPADCPPALGRLLRACLDPDPARRPVSAGELARQLDLCLLPRTQGLLEPPTSGWRAWAIRRPAAAVLVAGLVPNGIAAAFNYVYNRAEIVASLASAAADPARVTAVFETTQAVINGLAFPLGIGLTLAMTYPLSRGLAVVRSGVRPAADDLARWRERCLNLGRYTVRISLGCWMAAGVAYPVTLNLAVGAVPGSVYLHFLSSMALCGLVAAAWPFFAVAVLAVRAFYPALLRAGWPAEGEDRRLGRLGVSLWPMLGLAAAVPLLAVAVIVFLGTPNQFALGALSGAGLAGFGLAFVAARRVQADIDDLLPAVRTQGERRV